MKKAGSFVNVNTASVDARLAVDTGVEVKSFLRILVSTSQIGEVEFKLHAESTEDLDVEEFYDFSVTTNCTANIGASA